MTKTLAEHLAPGGPKRILALDGGGVMGVIEIAFLEQIEKLLQNQHHNPKLRLCDYFDLIGGTSTGSIIATALALGMSAAEVKDLYFRSAKAIFRPRFGIPYLTPRFSERGLQNILHEILRDETIASEKLKTGLAIVSKRIDTGSVWVLSNNPKSKFWNDPEPNPHTGKREYVGNKHYLLRDIIRASTAAPYFFAPHRMKIVDGEPDGLFVDGGVSPHNNPSLMMLMLAGINGYRYNWTISKNKLLMISLGTGWIRPKISIAEEAKTASSLLAVNTLRGVIWDGQVNALTLLQWLSEPRYAWQINGEINGLEGELINSDARAETGEPEKLELLKFQRYDMRLDVQWLKEHAEEDITEAEIRTLNQVMNPSVMGDVYRCAQKCSKKMVQPDDFPDGFKI